MTKEERMKKWIEQPRNIQGIGLIPAMTSDEGILFEKIVKSPGQIYLRYPEEQVRLFVNNGWINFGDKHDYFGLRRFMVRYTDDPKIPASLVMKLRYKTGFGIMDCKRALLATGERGDEFKESIDWLKMHLCKAKAALIAD